MLLWHRYLARALSSNHWVQRPLRSISAVSFERNEILTDNQRELVEKQKIAMMQLKATISEIDSNSTFISTIDEQIDHIGELFLLCVVGEFNVGKSR